MHYANGREAKNGDKVVLIPSYGPPTIGILYDATAGNDHCNGRIAPIAGNDLCPDLKACLHYDDLLNLLPGQEGVLAETHPDIFKRIALVPDSSKSKA